MLACFPSTERLLDACMLPSKVTTIGWQILQWGAVERQAQKYDWSGYRQLFEVVKNFGLSIQVVLSFHSCGGNVGDSAQIPLPKWVLKVQSAPPAHSWPYQCHCIWHCRGSTAITCKCWRAAAAIQPSV